MIRGLQIRQSFMLLDLLLTLAVVITAGIVVMKVIEAPAAIETVDAAMLSAEAAFVPSVAEKAAYARIREAGFFGDAGRWDPDAEPVAPVEEKEEPQDEVVETDFNLRLLGTIALGKEDPFSSACIENLDQRGSVHAYSLGELVLEKVTLTAVSKREVVLLNERNSPPTRERLSMDDEPEEGVMAKAPARQMPVRNSRGSDRITLNKQEFIQELYTSYADLVTKVHPEMVRDASGKVIGVTADNIGKVPLAKKLGLDNGDVLQTVNNEQIDSEQKIMEIAQKYRDSSSFRLGIKRNGKPQVLTVRFE